MCSYPFSVLNVIIHCLNKGIAFSLIPSSIIYKFWEGYILCFRWYNKLPQSWWLKKTIFYSFGCQKSRSIFTMAGRSTYLCLFYVHNCLHWLVSLLSLLYQWSTVSQFQSSTDFILYHQHFLWHFFRFLTLFCWLHYIKCRNTKHTFFTYYICSVKYYWLQLNCRIFAHSIHREWLKHYYPSVAASHLYYTPVPGNHHFTTSNTLQHMSVIFISFRHYIFFNFQLYWWVLCVCYCGNHTFFSISSHFVSFLLFYLSLPLLCRMRRKNIFTFCFILQGDLIGFTALCL